MVFRDGSERGGAGEGGGERWERWEGQEEGEGERAEERRRKSARERDQEDGRKGGTEIGEIDGENGRGQGWGGVLVEHTGAGLGSNLGLVSKFRSVDPGSRFTDKALRCRAVYRARALTQ